MFQPEPQLPQTESELQTIVKSKKILKRTFYEKLVEYIEKGPEVNQVDLFEANELRQLFESSNCSCPEESLVSILRHELLYIYAYDMLAIMKGAYEDLLDDDEAMVSTIPRLRKLLGCEWDHVHWIDAYADSNGQSVTYKTTNRMQLIDSQMNPFAYERKGNPFEPIGLWTRPRTYQSP